MINPVKLFEEWFLEAKEEPLVKDHTAMSLATCSKDGKPSVRIVLLKEYDAKGFVFYTNLNSNKGKNLLENKQVALCFYWPELDKQIRIEGKIEKVQDDEADAYFASRARGSQISSWASKQSQNLESYQDFLDRIELFDKRFVENKVERPEFWSGFRVVPDRVEFWEEIEFRRHKRILYERDNAVWNKKLLYP